MIDFRNDSSFQETPTTVVKKNKSTFQKNLEERRTVGRAQETYTPNNKLSSILMKENKLWWFPASSAIFNIILVLVLVEWLKNHPYSFMFAHIIDSVAAVIPFITTFILVPIFAKMFFNRFMRKTFEKGVRKQTPFWNTFASALNLLVNFALCLAAIIGAFYFYGGYLKNIGESLMGFSDSLNISLTDSLPVFASFLDAFYSFWNWFGVLELKWQALIVLLIAGVVFNIVVMLTLIVTIVRNMAYSVIVLICSNRLLPKDVVLNSKTRITNYHPHDLDKVEEIFRRSSRMGNEASEGAFESFARDRNLNTMRVIIEDDVPIGFYTLNEKRNIMLELKIVRNKLQDLLKPVVDDFITNTQELKHEEIQISVNTKLQEQHILAEFLEENDWRSTDEETKAVKTYKKRNFYEWR